MTNIDIQIIKANIKAQLDGTDVAPLFLSGSPGTGKSKANELLAKELDMNIHVVSAPTLSTEILTGLPNDYKEPKLDKYTIDNSKAIATVWSIPEIIADVNKLAEKKDTILLLDDFHMIGKHLQAYFFKLLLQRSIGNYKLANNVVILGTMNDSEEAGFNGINSAVRNRMDILKLDFDFDYWFESFGKKLHYMVASYLKSKPSKTNEEESVGIEGYATARSWTHFANKLNYFDTDFIVKNAKKLCGSHMSTSIANDFAKHVNYINAIDFEKTVKEQKMVKLSTLEPLDSILYSYIVHFIKEPEDAIYLLELAEYNINDESFIGFLFGELYTLYTQEEKRTLGINLVLDLLIEDSAQDVVAKYKKLPKSKKDKILTFEFKHKEKLYDIAQNYIL